MTQRRANRRRHHSARTARRAVLLKSRQVHRRTGKDRVRFTLNLRSVLYLPRSSERYIEYKQAFKQFCHDLGNDWDAWLRKAPPADAGKDCSATRPCRFFACEHHLAVERARRNSLSLRLLHPRTKLARLPFTCVFDVVHEYPDGASMSLIGDLLALKKQGVHYHWRLAQQRWRAITRELEAKPKKVPPRSEMNRATPYPGTKSRQAVIAPTWSKEPSEP